MPSFKTTFVAAATLLASTASADYVIDPSSVSLSQRTSWCQSETSTCPIICQQIGNGKTDTNTCDPKTLTYGCVCGNGMQPNVSEYSLTLPYFTCQEWGNQCVKACGQDNTCSSACREDHPCGAQSPTPANTTSTTTAAPTTSSTSSSTQIYDGLNGATSKPNAAPPNFESGHYWGLFTMAAGVVVGFGLFI